MRGFVLKLARYDRQYKETLWTVILAVRCFAAARLCFLRTAIASIDFLIHEHFSVPISVGHFASLQIE
jgi:hypothetical protein